MKKLVFAVMATVAFATISFAQALSADAKRNIINSQMVTLVNVSKPFYVKGQSYPDFVKALAIPSPTVPTQDELMRKVYGYLNSSTPDCDIMKADNSVLGKFATDLANSPKNQGTPNDAYSARKKWWQIALNAVFNVALDLLAPGNDVTVDLFPDTIPEAIQR